ncbi:MAG: helix-turn-helix domain-containing protein [Actinomycetota bacterium]|jgi:excisionase family DNA binding protein|nr:helix-turn-helix domain-containing protein [Actinomycetota bacterium]
METKAREKEWMKVPEAAELLGVTRSRMYDLVSRGEVPAVRIGERSIRVNRRDLEEFLRRERPVVQK